MWELAGTGSLIVLSAFLPDSSAGMGAAYGTAKSGVGIASMGVMRPELVMKSIVPVVMAGVLGIYGLIIAVIISTGGEERRSPKRLPVDSDLVLQRFPACSSMAQLTGAGPQMLVGPGSLLQLAYVL